ncbi:50S ribosomal protein L25/general stress protein Ctc [Ketogulonicigenium robustum]|uniref:Large ribosomal subunit protein bL25 n=1 Tax=Ketogulonicigenium robustum TaxID=92947 RepID=A0A1W6NXG6_9RHOB|nr:50S ribosomal protein L25/general stress protein Ctc [Ketogulonicigenium robustum]ARO13881.1 50S ribosomal protein L25/general stress protein Ctc [Ketogulonicigenium robustum]
MAKTIELNATARTGTGKGAARQARRDGQVPGVIYGAGQEPVAINVSFNVLLKTLKQGGFLSTLIDLNVDGKTERVVCRGVQRHVVKDLPTHVDFMRLAATTRVNLHIPVHFVNEDAAPGVKRGGTVVHVRSEIELNVLASDIPEFVTVDLTGRNIGDVIHIADVTLPAGVKPTTERNFAIANISAPSGYVPGADE